MTTDIYDGVKGIVEVNSDTSHGCELCDFRIKGDEFSEAVNHYISKHGLRLLHIGNRTARDHQGELWTMSVAILGSDAGIPKQEVAVSINYF